MSDASIRMMCPNLTCRKVLAVPGTARGKTVRCRNCGTNIRVPAEQSKPGDQGAPPPAAQAG
ncbi:MAG: RNase P subunit RPR2 [Phycisphaerales bacterium]|jgi:RNase P subunit RPR2